jgi:glycosyltransferase involved in cell wall biosynthesis
MTEPRPLVSIGVPVYQGANYLDQTLSAIRDQDYEFLEILVSDNASTDATPDIIARHSGEDPRVRMVTQSENIGAAENYNEVFRMAEGEFFAWNAHDDLTTGDFVTSGVAALIANPDAVVAVALPFRVGPELGKLGPLDLPAELSSTDPAVRFRAAARTSPAGLVFGLFRRETLAKTRLHGHFSGSDRNFMAEVMLHGRLIPAGTSEFYLREHEGRSVRSHRRHTKRFSHDRDAWYAPERRDHLVFPNWRRLGHYIVSVGRAPLDFGDRVRCYLTIPRILFDDGATLLKMLGYDLVTAAVFMLDRVKSVLGLGREADDSQRSRSGQA